MHRTLLIFPRLRMYFKDVSHREYDFSDLLQIGWINLALGLSDVTIAEWDRQVRRVGGEPPLGGYSNIVYSLY